jgi:hypothetical protein
MLLPWLEAMPSLDNWVVDFFEQVEGLNTVVDNANSDVWQYYSASDCLVEGETFAGFFVSEFVLHLWGQEVLNKVLVFAGLRRETPWDFTVFALCVLCVDFLSHC